MATKICFSCNNEKCTSEFYKHSKMADGFIGKCKECTKRDVRENREKKREQYAEYERQRFQRPERRAYAAEALKRHRKRNPEKSRARQAVSRAVRTGKLAKLPCEKCGNIKSQGHHEDYSKPLDVKWLCFRCHRESGHGQVVLSADDGIKTKPAQSRKPERP